MCDLPNDAPEAQNEPSMSLEQRFKSLGKRVRAASQAKIGLTLNAVEVQVLGMTVLANWQDDEEDSDI